MIVLIDAPATTETIKISTQLPSSRTLLFTFNPAHPLQHVKTSKEEVEPSYLGNKV